MGNKVGELVGFEVNVPVAVARLRQLRGLPQRGCDAHCFAVSLAQLFHTRPIQTLRRHRPRRIRTRANPHAHWPLGRIRVIVKRLLHDVDQLELYLVNGVLPLIEPAQQLRSPPSDRPRIEQGASKLVPWHRPRRLRHGPQLAEGNPVGKLIGHIIRQRTVINVQDSWRGRHHLREPAALAQAGGQLPHREPLIGLVSQPEGHAPGAHELAQPAVGMDQPLEVRRDGGGRLVVQVFHLRECRDGLLWAEHRHGHHQGNILALWRTQRYPRPVAEGFLPQDGLHRWREGALGNGIGHNNLVPFYLFNP